MLEQSEVVARAPCGTLGEPFLTATFSFDCLACVGVESPSCLPAFDGLPVCNV